MPVPRSRRPGMAAVIAMVALATCAVASRAWAIPTPPSAVASAPVRAGHATVPGLGQRIDRPSPSDMSLLRRGESLFGGQAALRGALVGQQIELPPAALRCGNCHQPPAAAAAGARPAIGSPLNAASLRTPAVRRGGPPSYYTEESLCALLRDGIDPGQVMVAPTMPRYTLAAGDCTALWAFLTQTR